MSNALMRVRGAKIHVVISKIKLRTGRNFGKTLLSGAIRTILSVLCWNTHKQVSTAVDHTDRRYSCDSAATPRLRYICIFVCTACLRPVCDTYIWHIHKTIFMYVKRFLTRFGVQNLNFWDKIKNGLEGPGCLHTCKITCKTPYEGSEFVTTRETTFRTLNKGALYISLCKLTITCRTLYRGPGLCKYIHVRLGMA